MTTQDERRWQGVHAEIRKTLRKQQYDTWFRRVQFASPGGETVQLIVPNRFYADWLATHYRSTVERAVRRVLGFDPEVCFEIDAAACQRAEDTTRDAQTGVDGTVGLAAGMDLETFVVGNCNRLAQAAARSVAECPGTVYNPLYVHSTTGMGKTHLLQAICRRFSALHPDDAVAYVPASTFIARAVQSRAPDGGGSTRSAYPSAALLALDDVHLLTGKESSQEAFFHLFNELHGQKRQVVVSGDRPPQDIRGLSERLVSRLRWGLIVGLDRPDEDTRAAIVRRWAAAKRLEIPDDVITHVASRVNTSIRELEAALVRVSAYASLSGKPMTPALAREALSAEPPRVTEEIDVQRIQEVVAQHFGLKLTDLVSKTRSRSVAFPRQVGMYLARSLTRRSLGEIGKRFGRRDHATVLYACEKIRERKEKDASLAGALKEIRAVLVDTLAAGSG